jgi:hypothetical protein
VIGEQGFDKLSPNGGWGDPPFALSLSKRLWSSGLRQAQPER